jgi:hypothetical protein
MRRTLTLCRGGLTAVAALVLLTACGGSSEGSDNAAAASSSEPTSSSAENTAPQADSEFCTQAHALTKTLDTASADPSSDPAALTRQFQQAADAVRTLNPPAELAGDWEKLAGGLEQFGRIYAQYDPADPASQSTFQQQTAQLQSEYAASFAKVGTYLIEQCGIDTGETGSASPTG